jgi:tight adherence protein B
MLFVAIFIVIFIVAALGVGLGQAFFVSRQKAQIRNMLRRADTTHEAQRPNLLKPEKDATALAKAFENVLLFRKLRSFLEQSGLSWDPPKFLSLSLIAGAAGTFVALFVPPFCFNRFAPLVLGPITAFLPFLIVVRKRSKRLSKFEEQFPEALNFLSRSMRAGHAFSIGLEMLVSDAPEPLGTCFRQMLNDLHLGAELEAAMNKLATAVPLIDVRFFVSAVLLQQGTGGNLSEILDSMANIIRERFRVKGQIKAASAHGRVTGLILAIMPVVVAIILFFISPEYLLVLANDPDGKKMVIAAVVAQIVGFFCIRKITDIKV